MRPRAERSLAGPLGGFVRALARRPAGVLVVVVAVAALTAAGIAALPLQAPVTAHVVTERATTGGGRQETSRILAQERGAAEREHLRRASAAPDPAPPSVSDSPPMVPGEVLAFAPYWTLAQQTTFDLSGVDTVSYFGLGVNANGTLQRSGTGWVGFTSQDFADLVTRAHDSGVRVVLTVNCFSQAALNQLTSSRAAAATLARQAVAAMQAENLDGVNLDLEGQGPTDAAGLTRLVATVSAAVHAVNPESQVTIDTYASSASGAGSFFDIPALSKVVNGFFVMAYDLNLSAGATPASPMTSTQFPDSVAAAQYAAAVPGSMVVFGASFFGYTWPTTNGTLVTAPTGPPVPISFGQVLAGGHPMYWDPVTDTSWTSYEVGDQWYEAYFEDPESLFLVAQLAHRYGFGTGVWALGMQGADAAMLSAVEGKTPGTGVPPAGPTATSPSGPSHSPTIKASKLVPAGPTSTTTSTSTSTSTTSTSTSTTSTTAPGYRYSGVWDTHDVSMRRIAVDQQPATAQPTAEGSLSAFATTDPAVSCLEATLHPMTVVLDRGARAYVVEARTPEQCVTADFVFPESSVTASS